MNLDPFYLSLRLAAVVTAGLLVLGIPLAGWLSQTRWKWKFLVESMVALPIVLPPTVLGYYILVAISPNSWLGSAYLKVFGDTLPFTFQGLVLASLLYSLPFAVQPFLASFESVDLRLSEAAWMLGASRIKTFLTVVLPSSVPGLLTGIVLSFAHTLGEFGVVLLVGGNIPGSTRVVSIAIFDNVQSMEYHEAGQMSLVLLVFSFMVLALVYAVNRRIWAVSPKRF
ncbi:MAG: molybdate ABC transporter permease subunit [Nitrospinae bacterium CG11_big_fil_rev_8_21_14_0_20_56_8]|nr:MAG: molybdate ABC transporter permease subunit [Nitrospinae bacterium CG11_big_fil_rev_8_21_14_0_20_56_8]